MRLLWAPECRGQLGPPGKPRGDPRCSAKGASGQR
jgi:hypothetical protein